MKRKLLDICFSIFILIVFLAGLYMLGGGNFETFFDGTTDHTETGL